MIQLTPDSRAKHEAELLMLFSRHDEDGDGRMKADGHDEEGFEKRSRKIQTGCSLVFVHTI